MYKYVKLVHNGTIRVDKENWGKSRKNGKKEKERKGRNSSGMKPSGTFADRFEVSCVCKKSTLGR
jgi:hypothetical protein